MRTCSSFTHQIACQQQKEQGGAENKREKGKERKGKERGESNRMVFSIIVAPATAAPPLLVALETPSRRHGLSAGSHSPRSSTRFSSYRFSPALPMTLRRRRASRSSAVVETSDTAQDKVRFDASSCRFIPIVKRIESPWAEFVVSVLTYRSSRFTILPYSSRALEIQLFIISRSGHGALFDRVRNLVVTKVIRICPNNFKLNFEMT